MTNSPNTPTIFLTGASGLLGRFVLARLLAAGHEVAVLVRPSLHWTAPQRVEEALAASEQFAWLPRPRTLPGNLNDDGLSLRQEDRLWLSQRPLEVIHCAASIRFQCDAASGEPYRTNVDGTRNLLEACKHLDMRAFHYVSTAYVSCRVEATGKKKLPEAMIDDVAFGGNDYEKSKIEAEQLVARSAYIGDKTIHRPSIIVGDSQSGFTSSFHGFYAPLHIGHQLANQFGFSASAGEWFRQQLGLKAQDSKNLVPVDWVAEAIVRSLTPMAQPATRTTTSTAQPRVLHWTNPKPVPCDTLQEAIATAIQNSATFTQKLSANLEGTHTVGPIPQASDFRQQMQAYESYFRSDPDFDTRQSLVAVPDLPCPVVDRELLLQLAKYAIDHNFGWPKPQPHELPHQPIVNALRDYPVAHEPLRQQLGLRLLGPGAPETLYFASPKCFEAPSFECNGNASGHCASNGTMVSKWFLLPAGRHLPAVGRITLNLPLSLLVDFLTGKTSVTLAIERGYCIMEGLVPQARLAIVGDWIQDVTTRISQLADH